MVFKFFAGDGAWRRIVDVQNRQSDDGFYVDPGNHLNVFPLSPAGTTAFTTNAYHHVVLTQSSGSQITGYLDGHLEFTLAGNVMNIANAGNLMNFFLDNTVGGGQGEYSSGDVALIRLYNGILASDQVARLAADPFPSSGPTAPEPSSLAMLGMGLVALVGMGWRRSRKQA
jgi:hypothetical protein